MADALAPPVGIALDDDQRLAWLQLIRSENVGPTTFRELINHCGSASNALDALPELASRGRARKSLKVASRGDAEAELLRLQSMGGRMICLGEPDYPSALREADGAPPVLSVLGNADCMSRHAVAFVGSRNASLSGIKMARALAGDVGKRDYVTISGLARGIDSAAHEASLATGTIAVFAGGVDHIYPSENRQLARDIIDNGGALVSEMPLGTKPRAQDFPRRNRIVAGIALGLVVVEAARRSGSLISARLANEFGRIVMAVPGSPLDPRSEGTNHLVREGAVLIRNPDDIIEALEPLSNGSVQTSYSLSEPTDVKMPAPEPSEDDRQKVVSALDRTPTDIDELIRHTGLMPQQVQIVLLELSLAGTIERHPGNRVSLI